MPKVVVTDSKGLIQESGAGIEVKGAEDGATPAYIAIADSSGTLHYLSVNDSGELIIESAAPTDGTGTTKVGAQ